MEFIESNCSLVQASHWDRSTSCNCYILLPNRLEIAEDFGEMKKQKRDDLVPDECVFLIISSILVERGEHFIISEDWDIIS